MVPLQLYISTLMGKVEVHMLLVPLRYSFLLTRSVAAFGSVTLIYQCIFWNVLTIGIDVFRRGTVINKLKHLLLEPFGIQDVVVDLFIQLNFTIMRCSIG